jgi:hypothetical protein
MFQFSIREVLLLTLVVALYLGWFGDRQGQAARIEWLEAELKTATTQSNINLDGYQRVSGRRDGLPINTEY